MSEQTVEFAWKKYSAHRFRNPRWALVTLATIGLVLGIFGALIPSTTILVIGLVLFLLPVPGVLSWRTKVSTSARGANVYGQPLWTNGALWFALLFGVMTVAALVQIVAGGLDDWRLVAGAVLGGIGVPALLRVAHRDRGPLVISCDRVELGNGACFTFETSHFGFVELSNGVPVVMLTTESTAEPRPSRLFARGYNVDFNSLLSTLKQLQEWSSREVPVSSAQIKAMLLAVPPADVEVGDVVQMTVQVKADP